MASEAAFFAKELYYRMRLRENAANLQRNDKRKGVALQNALSSCRDHILFLAANDLMPLSAV